MSIDLVSQIPTDCSVVDSLGTESPLNPSVTMCRMHLNGFCSSTL